MCFENMTWVVYFPQKTLYIKSFLKEERTFFIKNTLPFTFDRKHHLPFIESWLRRCVFSDAHGVDPALFSLNWYSFPPIRNLTQKIHKKNCFRREFLGFVSVQNKISDINLVLTQVPLSFRGHSSSEYLPPHLGRFPLWRVQGKLKRKL